MSIFGASGLAYAACSIFLVVVKLSSNEIKKAFRISRKAHVYLVGLGRLELQTSSMSTKNMPFYEYPKLSVNDGKDRHSKVFEAF